ncbi:hypothetical protein DI53_0567 [Sphingobacterium deserti]|uniref:Uncharacterized protein n=1 Tax=Sphingobacterium deserti TaxID=1229276 RepID=A0A0B8TBQ1_9SPHI|nr:hypothetical protein DI53_0567 [Sphingobacterium deserti]
MSMKKQKFVHLSGIFEKLLFAEAVLTSYLNGK